MNHQLIQSAAPTFTTAGSANLSALTGPPSRSEREKKVKIIKDFMIDGDDLEERRL
jgi:hypothetical protein